MVEVVFDRPIGEVFAYLSDPSKRPQWQSSLRRIADADPGPPHVGQNWTDVTAVGARPRMHITEMAEPHDGSALWSEEGDWRGVTARLTLRFRADGDQTVVTPDFEIWGALSVTPLVAVLRRLAPMAVRSDLRRAAALLARGA